LFTELITRKVTACFEQREVVGKFNAKYSKIA